MTETAPPLVEAPAKKIAWQHGRIEAVVDETYRVKSFRISMPEWRTFRPGQHVDVRLTAPDGYQALRSYSIASAPEMTGAVDLTIELVPEGEVSTWFHDVAAVGDPIEVRGPIGGPFTWTVEAGGPLLLVGGGSGVVPLMSMLRHRGIADSSVPAVLLYSARNEEDLIYRRELTELDEASDSLSVVYTLTRSQPEHWTGYSRRVDVGMLKDVIDRIGTPAHVFVCGPTSFVENVAVGLVSIGVGADLIRTERFGPSG